jgi:AcrR family transcriptional regulator
MCIKNENYQGVLGMTSRSNDARVLQTKRMIRDALTTLMEEKGFEGITVRDLAERAAINRGTFYLHYKDKYDLLEQCEDEVLKEILTIIEDIEKSIVNTALTSISQNEPLPFLVTIFEYFFDNSLFLKCILGPKGDPSFQIKLKNVMKENILQKLLKHIKSEEMIVPIDYFFAYVSSAHLGVIQHWLENGLQKTPREMALIISRTTFLGPGYVAGLKK